MKVKQKSEKPKGSKKSVLRGPKVPKKMKLVNKLPIKPKNKEPVKVETPKKDTVEAKAKNLAGNTLDLTPKMVKQGVQVLLELHEDSKKNSKSLLLTDKDHVFLQMVFMRKPEVPEKRRKYLKLHHCVYGEDPEICLFVEDCRPSDRLKRTPDERIEYSVNHYEEYLKKRQIEGISTIMPVFQFRTEFDSYELRRKLVDRFDLFLCQSNLLDNGKFLKNLGIAWNKRNKIPLAVKFPKKSEDGDTKFKDHLEELIKTTWFWLKPHADTVSMRIGSVNMTQEQLAENISYVLHQIKETSVVPGGVANIKSLLLKTSKSKAIPLYINLASPNSVPIPKVESIRPLHEAVEDELSTKPGKKVTVLPTGEVFVNNDPNQKLIPEWQDELTDEEGDFFDDSVPKEDSSDDEEVVPKKKVKAKEESDDSDAEAEKAEMQYFAARSKEVESSDDEVVEKQIKKVIKKKKSDKKKPKLVEKKIESKKSEKKSKPEVKKSKDKKKVAKKNAKK